MPMFGLPRARTLHPDKQIGLTRLFKPQPKGRRLKPKPQAEPSKLITNLAYKLHAQHRPKRLSQNKTPRPATRPTGGR